MLLKVLIDINIFEDVSSIREGYLASSEVIILAKKKLIEGWISANTIGVLYYLKRKYFSEEEARLKVTKMIDGFSIIPLRKNIVSKSLQSKLPDFEDNIQIESASQFNLDAIITRNKKDFKNSSVPAYTPEEFLEKFSQKQHSSKISSLKVPFLDLKAQLNDVYNDIDDEITNIISNTSFVLGKSVSNFESVFAKAHDAKYCYGVSSGTDGNHMVLWALGIGPGDEVIIPANTFIATAWGATLCGAKPVFVDCHPESYNINPEKIASAITEKTKAIVAVHLYGQAADIDSIKEALNSINFEEEKTGIFRNSKTGQIIYLAEDCAQAHLSEYKGKKVGTLGIASSWSFYPGKNLGAYGEAGAVMTNDDELAKKFKMIRDHGAEQKYIHQIYGHNYRMEAIQGAVLGVKLKYLKEWTDKRRNVAKRYNELLKNVKEIKLPKEMDYAKHVYHLYVIQVHNKNKNQKNTRDKLQKFLNDNGISTGLHYPIPLHLQPCFQDLGYKKGDFLITEELSEHGLSLPMYPEITDEQIEYICEKIKSFF